MKTPLHKLLVPGFLLAVVFFSAQVQAQPSCTKKMLNDPISATDQCLSDQVDAINSRIEKRYAKLLSDLPDVSTPATATEYEGLSKERMQDVYTTWKSYQQKACSAYASSYGLQRRYENRMHSICWITAAKQHLVMLK